MTPHPTTPQAARRPSRRRRGFTFMEILFAVMILGIGFIMVAAMFPAAIQQTQAAVDENQYNSVVRIATETMRGLSYTLDKYPPTPPAAGTPTKRLLDVLTSARSQYDTVGQMENTQVPSNIVGARPVIYCFHDARLNSAFMLDTGNLNGHNPYSELWDLVRGNLIVPDNPQYAWVPFWSREFIDDVPANTHTPEPFIRLLIVPVRARTKPQYDPNPLPVTTPTFSGTGQVNNQNKYCDVIYDAANLDPTPINIDYIPPAAGSPSLGVIFVHCVYFGPNWIKRSPNLVGINPVAPGSYIILSDAGGGKSSSGIKVTDPATGKTNFLAKAAFNGTVFRVGEECDANGNPGSSGGVYWSVTAIDFLPAGLTSPSQIQSNTIQGSTGQTPFAFVVGKAPDPTQLSDPQTRAGTQQFQPLPRTGQAQDLGILPYSVSLQGGN